MNQSPTIRAVSEMEPRLADDCAAQHRTDIGGTTVLTVITIIAEHELFVLAQLDFILCNTG